MKCLCLQALTIVYGKCFEEIGPFADTKYIVGMLDRVSQATERLSFVMPRLPEMSNWLFAVYRQAGKGPTHPLLEQADPQQGKRPKDVNSPSLRKNDSRTACFPLLQKNVKDIMDSNGVRILVDVLTLAHLHTSRATVPLQVKTFGP